MLINVIFRLQRNEGTLMSNPANLNDPPSNNKSILQTTTTCENNNLVPNVVKDVEVYATNSEIIDIDDEDDDDGTTSALNKTVQLSELKVSIPRIKVESVVNYACDKCPKFFSDKSLLISHKETHNNGVRRRKYLCYVCSQNFKNEEDLAVHKSLHSDENKEDSSSEEEEEEEESSVDEPSEELSNGSDNESNCSNSSDTRYACVHCPNKYLQMSSLSRHLKRVHKNVQSTNKDTGKRAKKAAYTCDMCYDEFTDLTKYNKHLDIHKELTSGSKPPEPKKTLTPKCVVRTLDFKNNSPKLRYILSKPKPPEVQPVEDKSKVASSGLKQKRKQKVAVTSKQRKTKLIEPQPQVKHTRRINILRTSAKKSEANCTSTTVSSQLFNLLTKRINDESYKTFQQEVPTGSNAPSTSQRPDAPQEVNNPEPIILNSLFSTPTSVFSSQNLISLPTTSSSFKVVKVIPSVLQQTTQSNAISAPSNLITNPIVTNAVPFTFIPQQLGSTINPQPTSSTFITQPLTTAFISQPSTSAFNPQLFTSTFIPQQSTSTFTSQQPTYIPQQTTSTLIPQQPSVIPQPSTSVFNPLLPTTTFNLQNTNLLPNQAPSTSSHVDRGLRPRIQIVPTGEMLPPKAASSLYVQVDCGPSGAPSQSRRHSPPPMSRPVLNRGKQSDDVQTVPSVETFDCNTEKESDPTESMTVPIIANVSSEPDKTTVDGNKSEKDLLTVPDLRLTADESDDDLVIDEREVETVRPFIKLRNIDELIKPKQLDFTGGNSQERLSTADPIPSTSKGSTKNTQEVAQEEDKDKEKKKKWNFPIQCECGTILRRYRSWRKHNESKKKCTIENCTYMSCKPVLLKLHYEKVHKIHCCFKCDFKTNQQSAHLQHMLDYHKCSYCQRYVSDLASHRKNCKKLKLNGRTVTNVAQVANPGVTQVIDSGSE